LLCHAFLAQHHLLHPLELLEDLVYQDAHVLVHVFDIGGAGVVVHDVDAELVGLGAEVGADPQDGLSQAEGIPHFPARPGVDVRLVQYGHHDVALLDSADVLLEDMLCMVMGRGNLLRQ